jgi:hypothetical protein
LLTKTKKGKIGVALVQLENMLGDEEKGMKVSAANKKQLADMIDEALD